jgi:hypothetical protein
VVGARLEDDRHLLQAVLGGRLHHLDVQGLAVVRGHRDDLADRLGEPRLAELRGLRDVVEGLAGGAGGRRGRRRAAGGQGRQDRGAEREHGERDDEAG